MEPVIPSEPQAVMIGRYLLHRQIARGGMATIHIARLMGDEGFTRIVAAKRLLPEFAEDAEFVAMFLDEARIASKVHHRNVVPVLDVVTTGEEAILVQEYVHGAPLHALLRVARQSNTRIPLEIAVSIACQVLAGLHAAHETLDELGTPLNIVHRDVSPQNVMIAVDGTARLLDFGVAKATMAAHVTREGQFKGKLAYSAPEQLRGNATRQSDVYSLAVLLWELVVGHRMHNGGQAEVELVSNIMSGRLPTITEALAPDRDMLGADRWRDLQAIEPILKTALAVDVTERWLTAADMERALNDVIRPAAPSSVAVWLKSLGKDLIDKHERVLAAEEASWRRVGTTVQRRASARASTSERGRPQGSFTNSAGPAVSQPRPEAPARHWGIYALLAVLCGVVIVLGVGVVLAMRSPAKSAAEPLPAAIVPAPARPEPPTPPMPTSAAAAQPGVAKTVTTEQKPAATDAGATGSATQAPAAVRASSTQPAGETATAQTPAATTQSPSTPPAETARAAPAPASVRTGGAPSRPQRAPVRQAAPSGKRPASESSAPASTPATAPAAAPNTDCNPPYYYEGPKKIFKTNCL